MYIIYIYQYIDLYIIQRFPHNCGKVWGQRLPMLTHSLYGLDGRARGRPPNGPYTRIANAYTLTTTGEPKGRIRVKELIVRSTRNQRLNLSPLCLGILPAGSPSAAHPPRAVPEICLAVVSIPSILRWKARRPSESKY